MQTIATGSQTPGAAEQATAEPVSESQRIVSLDVLRGFALLGILFINLPSMAMISAARTSPYAYLDATASDVRIWGALSVLADGKFMAIFSMLFGAGTFLMADRLDRSGTPAWPAYGRRLLFLFVVGMAHAYLLWHGDILVSYAICGATVFLFRKCGSRTLILCAGIFFVIGMVTTVESGRAVGFAFRQLPEIFPTEVSPQAETLAFRGRFMAQLPMRASYSFASQTVGFAISSYWRIVAAMLLGIALIKGGYFAPGRKSVFFGKVALVAGLQIGIALAVCSVASLFYIGWDSYYGLLAYELGNYLSSIPCALGWIGAILLLMATGARAWLAHWVAPLGRMAFTNYLLQTIIGTTIFYGHGLGMFGKVHRASLLLIAIGIWLFQLVLSAWWMSRFRFGPLEWLWRGFTYKKLPPIRRAVPA
ncbi:DUF418 domain-containing protein [Terracidiphilus sp.]|jgi:uncharacterized protein|uniref:DUF418 domain-containing protein n=1 Tax=Terracidiphilus sp. TaxID=1964191 RepID=UPI003C24F7B4